MPTPQEQYLSHIRTGDAGGFVPRNVEEAEAEFTRLVDAGMPEAEAEATIIRRVKPPGALATQGAGFVGGLIANAGDLASGAVDTARQFNGLRAIYDPRGFADDVTAARSAMGDTLTRGLSKAREAWDRSALEAAGRTAAIPFDMAGLPVSRAGERIGAGQVGAGLADALTSVAGAVPRGIPPTAQALRHPITTGTTAKAAVQSKLATGWGMSAPQAAARQAQMADLAQRLQALSPSTRDMLRAVEQRRMALLLDRQRMGRPAAVAAEVGMRVPVAAARPFSE